ncbi:hypothetical protein C8R45DRAFT_489424 [Mycena sanguinolenta]|nr:hypothetical protein C8R45DRAFT_489424 [Mycena sanguinolenta]
MDTPRTAPDRTDLRLPHHPGLYYHPLHLCSSSTASITPTTHASCCCSSVPPCLIAALACRPNCRHAPDANWNPYLPDAYWNPYPTAAPTPPKARNRGRRRRRNNNSSSQSPAQNASAVSTSNLKRTQTNVDGDRPAKRARTGSFPSEYGAASTHRAPQVGATNERADFARVTGGRGGSGGSGGVNGGNGGIGTGPINMNLYFQS